MSKVVSKGFRIEYDSMGELQVFVDVLWGVQIQCVVQNFLVLGQCMLCGFICVLGLVKGVVVGVNVELGYLLKIVVKVIQIVVVEVVVGNWDVYFLIDVYQMGLGMLLNMNVNEVIVILVNCVGKVGKIIVYFNDYVNQGQSFNDVILIVLCVLVVLVMYEQLLLVLVYLCKIFDKKGCSLCKVVKIGCIYLMDVMLLIFEQEFGVWLVQLVLVQECIEDSFKCVCCLLLGGIVIGIGINVDLCFGVQVVKVLK